MVSLVCEPQVRQAHVQQWMAQSGIFETLCLTLLCLGIFLSYSSFVSVFWLPFLCLCICVFLFSCCWVFGLFDCFLKKKIHKVGWVGVWRGIRRSWGREKPWLDYVVWIFSIKIKKNMLNIGKYVPFFSHYPPIYILVFNKITHKITKVVSLILLV